MFEEITADDIVAQVLLIRDVFKLTIMLVEGDSDVMFWEKYIDPWQCKLLPAVNKENAIGAVSLLDQDNMKGILAVVDADFDHISDSPIYSPNIVLTDYHDLEILIIQSPALEHFLREYASKEKISAYLKAAGFHSCRDALLTTSHPMGVLRLFSLQESLRLDFNGLDLNQFISPQLEVDVGKLLDYIVAVTVSRCKQVDHRQFLGQIDKSRILQKLVVMAQNTAEFKPLVCCGDDVVHLLTRVLRKLWGSRSHLEVSPVNIRAGLRLSYDTNYLKNTNLYRRIVDWEKVNVPLRVLAEL